MYALPSIDIQALKATQYALNAQLNSLSDDTKRIVGQCGLFLDDLSSLSHTPLQRAINKQDINSISDLLKKDLDGFLNNLERSITKGALDRHPLTTMFEVMPSYNSNSPESVSIRVEAEFYGYDIELLNRFKYRQDAKIVAKSIGYIKEFFVWCFTPEELEDYASFYAEELEYIKDNMPKSAKTEAQIRAYFLKHEESLMVDSNYEDINALAEAYIEREVTRPAWYKELSLDTKNKSTAQLINELDRDRKKVKNKVAKAFVDMVYDSVSAFVANFADDAALNRWKDSYLALLEPRDDQPAIDFGFVLVMDKSGYWDLAQDLYENFMNAGETPTFSVELTNDVSVQDVKFSIERIYRGGILMFELGALAEDTELLME